MFPQTRKLEYEKVVELLAKLHEEGLQNIGLVDAGRAMRSNGLYEPDKNLSGVQAFLILAAVDSTACVDSVDPQDGCYRAHNGRHRHGASPPPVAEPEPLPDLDKIPREQIEATQRNLEQAEIAPPQGGTRRGKKKRLEEEQIQRRGRAKKKGGASAPRARGRGKKNAKRRLKKRKEAEEAKRREEQARLKQEQEERQRALEEAEARRQAEAEARIKAARDARLMDRYIAGIHDKVKRHMTNPEGVPTDIKVEIRVLLQDNGTLLAVPEVEESSGNELFDEQAVRAVIRGAENGFDLPDDPELRKQFAELLLVIRPEANN